MTPDVLRLAAEVTARLQAAGLQVVIGGSVASSLVGEPRATVDLDVAISAMADPADALLAAFDDGYYISDIAVREATRRCSSFNVIHLETMQKVDIFILGSGALDTAQMTRRQLVEVGGDITLPIGAAEDQILRKLWWYRLGEETSERQWRDVVGILRIQQGRLDERHLDDIAAAEGLSDLLNRARTHSSADQ
ncbi:MAG: hypothetical protein ACR2HR_08895 [Euzebya sp.]